MNLREELLAKTAPSMGQMLRDRVAKTPEAPAFLAPDRAPGENTWEQITWAQTRHIVDEIAAGLLARGLQPEERVAIASSTRIEWVMVDLAIACAGGATTTVYPNTHADDVEYIVSHSGSVVFVAETPEQLDKITGRGDLDTQVHTVVLLEGSSDDPRVLSYADLRELGREHLAVHPGAVDEAIAGTSHDSLSTLIYTSGTTGRPKGVELSHLCWTYMGVAMNHLKIIKGAHIQYLWLPLSHVFGKCLLAVQLEIGFCSAVDGRIDRIVAGLGEVRPTFMCGAPRIFEKVRNAVMTGNTGMKAKIARWAFSVGRQSREYRLAGRPMPKSLAVKYRLAEKLVFSKLKKKMGGRIQFFISGSAKLSRRVQEWFYSAGLLIVEGYGMTETSAIAFVNVPQHPRFGTVGKVTPGVNVRIADDGEVLLEGPTITRGYHNEPELTAETIVDGWLHTGDIGFLDEEGNLTITDRKKDLQKTSGGKYVAPQKVETAITANIPYVSQAVAIADGRKYVSALVTMDRDLLLKWGAKRGLGDDYETLTKHPDLHASIARRMEKVNQHLERWETVKRFAILPEEFSVESGGVTANMKIRRSFVVEQYADVVESLYDDEGVIE
ncbi:MAG: long-chain fatty acid--CoA ligase [Propionibacteriaceae bacterium]|nr:long-chain fatty acid--CoA ligase [Propionibacteriaceae bacterium]